MTRTNIDIDDELIDAVMRENHLRTKREAVDFALRRARRPKPLMVDEILALEGIGWEGDLEAIKASRRFDVEEASRRRRGVRDR